MDAFYGEIRIFGFSFPPQNWAQCNGQQMAIQQYQVLYTVIGAQFGGNGTSTFNLPNLMGSAVCEAGQGIGLTNRAFATSFGTVVAPLNATQMPLHQHAFNGTQTSATTATNTPTTTSYLGRTLKQSDYTNTDTYDTTFAPQMVGNVGGGAPHENRQPYLVLNFCICMYGEYPIKA